MNGSVAREIEILLQEAFLPSRLDVINDSARHRGHMGDDGSGESHFTVVIESVAFQGKNRLERQRMINRALGDIPGNRVHALAIRKLEHGIRVGQVDRGAPAERRHSRVAGGANHVRNGGIPA